MSTEEETVAVECTQEEIDAGTCTPPCEGETNEDGTCAPVEPVYESDCLDIDYACLEQEQAARDAVAAEIAAAEAADTSYKTEGGMAHTSTTGLVCTMDGFTEMVQRLSEVIFTGLAVTKEVGVAMIPENFQKAVGFAWTGMVGMGNWVGYVLAAIYFAALEAGDDLASETCEAMGYGYWLVDNIYEIVDFIPKPDTTGGVDIANLATEAEKYAAASPDIAAALQWLEDQEAAAKAEIKEAVDAGESVY